MHAAIVGLDSLSHLNEDAAVATGFRAMETSERFEFHRNVSTALAGVVPPLEEPGYVDGSDVLKGQGGEELATSAKNLAYPSAADYGSLERSTLVSPPQRWMKTGNRRRPHFPGIASKRPGSRASQNVQRPRSSRL